MLMTPLFKLRRIAAGTLAFAATAPAASANVGIPLLGWPVLWLILFIVPVIAIEAWVLRRRLALTIGIATMIASGANVFSTLVGAILVIPSGILGMVPPGSPADVMTLVAFVPLYFLSRWMEASFARRYLAEKPAADVNRAMHRANLASYALLAAFVLLRLTSRALEAPCRFPLLQGCYNDIHRALSDGNLYEAKRIARTGEGLDLGRRSSRGETALHRACQSGDAELVGLLLARGADVHLRDRDGETALHLAAHRGIAVELLPLLIARGADVNARDNRGFTALHNAAREGNARVVALLLDRGADPRAADENGWTPLHLQGLEGNAAVARLLLARGADVNARDRSGRTPLHSATSVIDNAEAIRLMLDAGAEVNATDAKGLTPLDCATSAEIPESARARYRAAVQVLTERGGKRAADLPAKRP